jgi:hypothetical protein
VRGESRHNLWRAGLRGRRVPEAEPSLHDCHPAGWCVPDANDTTNGSPATATVEIQARIPRTELPQCASWWLLEATLCFGGASL